MRPLILIMMRINLAIGRKNNPNSDGVMGVRSGEEL